jgi:hypothetical protein
MGRREKSCQNQIEPDVDLIDGIDIANTECGRLPSASAVIS